MDYSDYMIAGILVMVALVLTYLINALRKEKHRRAAQNHDHAGEHNAIRQEIIVGDKKLELRIEVLEKRD